MFDPLDNAVNEVTTVIVGVPTWDPAYARCSIQVGAASNGARSPTWASAAAFYWIGTAFTTGGVLSTLPALQLLSGATVVCDIIQAPDNTVTVRTLQGGVLTAAGTLNVLNGIRNRIGLALIGNSAAGSVTGYLADTQVFTATGLNHAGWTGVTQIVLRGGSGNFYWSEVASDIVPHIGDRVWTYPIDSNSGVNTGWTGSVSDVDEIVTDDSTFIGAPTAALVSTFYANGFNMGTKNVVSVMTGSRAKKSLTGPSALKNTIRVDGANASGPTIALDVGYQACCTSWNTNPVLSGAWVAADAQTIEAGDTSVT